MLNFFDYFPSTLAPVFGRPSPYCPGDTLLHAELGSTGSGALAGGIHHGALHLRPLYDRAVAQQRFGGAK